MIRKIFPEANPGGDPLSDTHAGAIARISMKLKEILELVNDFLLHLHEQEIKSKNNLMQEACLIKAIRTEATVIAHRIEVVCNELEDLRRHSIAVMEKAVANARPWAAIAGYFSELKNIAALQEMLNMLNHLYIENFSHDFELHETIRLARFRMNELSVPVIRQYNNACSQFYGSIVETK